MEFRTPKIEWVGEILAKVGYGILTREFLYPIMNDVKLIAKEDYVKQEDKYLDGIWAERVIESMILPSAEIRVSFSIPMLYDHVPGKTNLGLSLWDLESIPKEWIDRMNSMDGMLFCSPGTAQVAINSGLKVPVAVFSPYIHTSRWANFSMNDSSIYKFSNTEDCVKYLLDESWAPTSNIEDTVIAFCIAFEGVKDACLVIRIDNASTVDQKKVIRGGIQSIVAKLNGLAKPRIIVVDDSMTEDEVNKLIKSCNYSVSNKSSVSFDLQTIRSVMLEVPVIGTELLNRDSSLLEYKVASYNTPILTNAPFTRFNIFSKKPDIKSLVYTLRYSYNLVKSDPNKYKKDIEKKKLDCEQKYASTNLIEVCSHLHEKIKEQKSKSIPKPMLA